MKVITTFGLLRIACLLSLLLIMGFRVDVTDGDSMEPTHYTGDLIIGIRASSLQVGDVVSFITPEAELWPKDQRLWCKRIASIQGDKLYLLGDNSETSYDSRNFGWVSRDQVVRKCVGHIPTSKLRR